MRQQNEWKNVKGYQWKTGLYVRKIHKTVRKINLNRILKFNMLMIMVILIILVETIILLPVISWKNVISATDLANVMYVMAQEENTVHF